MTTKAMKMGSRILIASFMPRRLSMSSTHVKNTPKGIFQSCSVSGSRLNTASVPAAIEIAIVST